MHSAQNESETNNNKEKKHNNNKGKEIIDRLTVHTINIAQISDRVVEHIVHSIDYWLNVARRRRRRRCFRSFQHYFYFPHFYQF